MPSSTSMSNKRQRLDPIDPTAVPPVEDAFIQDQDAVDSGGDDDEDDEKPKSDKKAGRRKIKIEFIQDKSRRHITFSKRKAGIMKKAYELSTLTGTQVLLLVVSETGLVYTFTTAKLQPLVTQPEGKNLIQACLNAPHGQLPSTMPVGAPLGRSAMSGVPHSPAQPAPPPNVPGGLSIGGKEDEGNDEGEAVPAASSADPDSDRGGRKRRRASSNAAPPNTRSGNSGPPASSGPPPPPPPPPSSSTPTGPPTNASQPPPPAPPPANATTSPHNRQQMLPSGLSIPQPQAQQMQPQSPSYPYPGGDPSAGMYGGYAGQPQPGPQGTPYGYAPPPVPTGHEQQQPGMAWGAPGVQQGSHYQRR